ncbi:MAG: HAD family hydrolase [Chloroflexota bacterium]
MALRAVIFDYGHTLVDFRLAEDALLDAYEQISQMLTAQAYQEVPEAPVFVAQITRKIESQVQESYGRGELEELDIVVLFEQALGALGLQLPRELVRQIAELEHRAMVSELTMAAENLAVLRDLKDLGLRLGLVSNAHFLPHLMREDIERLGIAQYLDASIFSAEIGVRKPHPSIFRNVLEAIPVQRQDAAFVGDRLRDDIAGATSLGMRGILTRQYRQEELDERVARPDLVIDRLPDLMPWVREQMAG